MKSDKPIIEQLTAGLDFYKFTMGQFIWFMHPMIRVTFALKNRTKAVGLAHVIDLSELRAELDHAITLRFQKKELDFLAETKNGKRKLFSRQYLKFLENFRLSDYEFWSDGETIYMEFTAPWPTVTFWETIALAVVDELYYRSITKGFTDAERKAIETTGMARLEEKIKFFKKLGVRIMEFGTRRAYSVAHHMKIIEALRDGIGDQLAGTSNVWAAMQFGIKAVGTEAHELPMVLAGVMEDETTDWLDRAQRRVVREWWDAYGEGLSIFLPDTFGTDAFLRAMSSEDIIRWRGFRWDSGDPYAFGERIIKLYEEHGVDPLTKVLVPSDGLARSLIGGLHNRFNGRIQMLYAPGTWLSNDLLDNEWHNGKWFGPFSLVVKPMEANGRGLVKLSDNLAKATGKPEDIERYKRAAGYVNTYTAPCKY